jgi:L-threonylcarbamoyladenylate synthase
MILDGNATKNIAACADSIRASGLIAFPTETVYGLGASADDDAAVTKIFTTKGRPADHPLIVHVQDAQAAQHFAAQLPEFAQQLMQAFWPGPLTVVVPRRDGVATASAGGQGSIGLRCPAHPVAQALLRACSERGVHGLAAPSANLFGRISPTTAQHVQGEFGDTITVLDGGPCAVGIESCIIDCTRGAPVLLRPGTLTREVLQAVLKQPLLSNDELLAQISRGSQADLTKNLAAPKASGTLQAHYAPRAKLRLMTTQELQAALDVLGADAKHIATYSHSILHSASPHIVRRRMPHDAAATAQQLFAVLRDFDAQGVKLIWVETPPTTSDWDGVRDRLQRAAAS